MLARLWFRFRAALRPSAVRAEFDDELRYHVEHETRENIKRGLTPADARRTALAEFGGIERFKESLRDERGMRWLDELTFDISASCS